MSGTVLIIEDDTRIANWVKVYFERAGFSAEVAYDGESGLALARNLNPDLVVLDLMLPRLDGVELCRILRRESEVPIIMLTAREAPAQRIVGLDSGADDYIIKPFDPQEVIARAQALLRRVNGRVQQVLTRGNITLNETVRSVTVNEEPVTLSQAQIALLSTFMRHPNRVLSRDQLISLTFKDEFHGFDRAIDSQIARLRKQISRDGSQPIQTVYGAGYKFVVEEVPPNLPDMALDRMRMSQALGNVLSNAIHCTEAGGNIVFKAVLDNGGGLTITIIDDGIGIDPADLPHVFDRFYRTDQSLSRGIAGTGLGLAITQAIVEAHGGTIAVTSDGLGRGVTTTIRLPLNK